jgi:hypothetical protein
VSGSARPRALAIAGILTAGILIGATAVSPAQDAGRPIGEGPLGNDVFLPTSEGAARALATGDEALAKKDDPASRDAALDSWWKALAESEAFECVPSFSSSGAPRGVEAVEISVARRLRAAGADVARAWRERFESGASAALVAAGDDPASLARVERIYPATRGGARAALALSDREYESGDLPGAATWLDRARAHADARDAPLAAAIARRSDALRAGTSRTRATGDRAIGDADGWRRAGTLVLSSTVVLPPDPGSTAQEAPRPGVEPGVALLEDGRVCVQGATSVHVVDDAGRTESLDLLSAVHGHSWVWPAPFAEEGERWPLLPATSGARIFAVAGRAARAQGNALIALEMRPGSARPELLWAYSDAGFLGPDGATIAMPEALGTGLWEFEPGPVVLEGALVLQARQWTGESEDHPSVDERSVRAWCLALDLATGTPRWKRLLASGASGKARLQGARGFAHPAQPLAAQDGRVLAGTAIGAAAWIDAVDGRITATFRYRRAPDGSRTWKLSAPIPLGRTAGEGLGPILWGPPDSDRRYLLAPEDGGEIGGAFRLESREIGRDAAPFAASGPRGILLAAGDRASFGSVLPATEERADSVQLPRSDREPARGLASEARVLAADDRAAYLLDVQADLRILASPKLPGRADDPLGSIAARGEHVYVAGERTLWVLNAR